MHQPSVTVGTQVSLRGQWEEVEEVEPCWYVAGLPVLACRLSPQWPDQIKFKMLVQLHRHCLAFIRRQVTQGTEGFFFFFGC